MVLDQLHAALKADGALLASNPRGQDEEGFVDFLFTKEAQEIFAKHGLRSPDPEVAKATEATYPPVKDLFTIDEFGGWSEATPTFFGDDGIFYKLFAQVQGIQVNDQ